MMIRTFVKRNPEIKEFCVQAKDKLGGPDPFFLFKTDDFDNMNNFGDWRIKKIEEAPEPGELLTLIV